MKKFVTLSFFYCMLGMFFGVFYRELTKFYHFTNKTVLASVHTHIIVFGVFFFLIVLLLEKSFALTKDKQFNKFYITYNVGLLASSIMMAVRGCVEVLRLELSTMADASISGIAGLSHIVMTIAYILFFLILLHRIDEHQLSSPLKETI